jgi:enoyl-CoA hydratase/carnithine racemase
MTDFTQFKLEIDKGVAVVTFNRPDKMNTFNPLVMTEMIRLFDLTDADDSIGAVVITGSGKAFCAGAELGVAGGDTFNYNKRDNSREEIINGVRRDGGGRVTLRIFNSLKPVIAACNGAAVGVGATMQLAMDFRLASTAARYGFVFARRGIVPEACSSWFLPRLVGVPTALEWIYSGRVFDAQEAKDKGLVQSLHAPDDLMPAAMEFARKLTEKTAPVAVAVSRRMVWTMLGAPHPMYAHRIDSRGIQTRGASADVKEGVESFMQKRDANFPNKVSSDMPDIFPPEPEFE